MSVQCMAVEQYFSDCLRILLSTVITVFTHVIVWGQGWL